VWFAGGHRSGYYAWQCHPHSARSIEDSRLSGLIKRDIYPTHDKARNDILDYIELLYNVGRRHGFTGQQSTLASGESKRSVGV